MILSMFLRNNCATSNLIGLFQPIEVLSHISKKRIPTYLLLFLFIISFVTCFGQATKVVITTQPVPGSGSGALMSVQPVVEIRDASDQRVTTSTAQVEIVIASGTGGSLGGTTRINAVNGIATFTDLTFTGSNNETYTFQFKSEPVIAYEPFAYAAGSLTGNNGGTGWSGAWFGPNPAFPDLTVNGSGLTYTDFSSSGGCATYTANTGGDGGRQLAAVSNADYNVVWLAFVGNYNQQGGGFNNVRLYLPSGLSGGIGGNAYIYNWTILDNSLNASTFTSSPLDGTMRLALLKIDYTAGTSSLWIDPAVASFDSTQTPSLSMNFAPVFDRIEIYNRYNGVSTDEITLASTYKAALHLEQNLTPDVSLGATLPVKWSYFTATCDGGHTLLKWGTANENNNSYFSVEKSADALVWLVIGKVRGLGNSGVDQHYQFSDSASSSKTYYRLRQVDFNGKADLSKVMEVHCESGHQMLRLFPNPAGDFLKLSGAQPRSRYELIDARGHTVKTGITLGGVTTISLYDLPGGNYFLRVTGFEARLVYVLKVKQ